MPKRTPTTKFIDSTGKEYQYKILTTSTAKAAFRPYAAEVGMLANAWNNLHSNLSSLFTLLLTAKNPHAAMAIWYSADSDVVQRNMLRALIKAERMFIPPPLKALISEDQAQDILYVLDEIDQGLRHKRNNAMHAPLMIVSGVHADKVRHWAEAHFNDQNPRANPLRGKDLIEEFRNYTQQIERLSLYVLQMWQALNPFYGARQSWPQRPPVLQAHNKKRSGRRGIPRLPSHRLKS
jgi:hypothetical protein